MTSRAAKGSSKRSIFGSVINAIAITNFFFCPPDKKVALISLTASNSNLDINESIFSSLKLLLFIVISATALKFSFTVRS